MSAYEVGTRVQPSSDFEKLRQECLASKKLFEDSDFLAINTSVYRSKEPPENEIIWLRPQEILKKQGINKTPLFVSPDGHGSRFDLKQGDFSNCWVLSSAASVCDIEGSFEWLVPQDQSFDPDWYAGIFRFRFYQYGENVEIYVDDRLPVNTDGSFIGTSSTDPRIFWGCLLEKAYAKVHGCYEAIEFGTNDEALIDFTGGLVEHYYIHEVRNLRRLLKKAFYKDSIVTAAIYGSLENPIMKNGLVIGHAYSVTGVGEVTKNEVPKKEFLVRVRNPWGDKTEWKGSWSDKSIEWNNLTDESKEGLSVIKACDGEFWMSVSDFKWQFDDVTLCNCIPDSVEDNEDNEKNWKVAIYHGQWKKGLTDGGLPTCKETFEKSQQYYMKFEDHDEDGLATVVIQISQKYRRQKQAEKHLIGFTVIELDSLVTSGDSDFSNSPLKYEQVKDKLSNQDNQTAKYDNGRDVTARFDLPPGQYVIIPTTQDRYLEAEYTLRIFSEAAIDHKLV